MFILRAAEQKDLDDLYELSQLVTFINLPPDRDLIEKKVISSLQAFQTPSKDLSENYYLFVLEDLEEQKVIGASMIHAQHGTEDEPHFFLTVGQENKFSTTINTGFIHGTLKLGLDYDGPTEIGGLILNPEYRKNDHKLGKQLSFVRFMYMSLYPQHFKEMIHSELMPPFDKEGRSPLWEAIGRRFMNMEYHDADVLSRSNKEFILSLFPSDTIYETLLPIDARNAIGMVGTDTLPVKKMLEKIGFSYTNEVDPFDGGPHYRARLKNIKPVQESAKVTLKFKKPEQCSHYLVMLTPENDPLFKAVRIEAQLSGQDLWVDPKNAQTLGLIEGSESFVMPLN